MWENVRIRAILWVLASFGALVVFSLIIMLLGAETQVALINASLIVICILAVLLSYAQEGNA